MDKTKIELKKEGIYMEKKNQRRIKFMSLIVFILILLIVVALVAGMIIKGQRQQQRVEQYQKQFEIENDVNEGE